MAKTEIQELSEFIRDHMLTKDSAREIVEEVVRGEVGPITSKLIAIRRDLDRLTETADNVLGYRKEIDHALERITALEKRLAAGANEVAA